MIKKLLLIFLAVFTCNFAHAESVQDHADKKCNEEWTKAGVLDQKMYDYCVNKSHEASKEVDFFKKKFADTPWFKISYPACENKWTITGIKHFDMIAYCLRKEKEGFEQFVYEEKQSSYDKELASLCFKKWQKNDAPFNMAAYCYKTDKNNKKYLANNAKNTDRVEKSTILNTNNSGSIFTSLIGKVKNLFNNFLSPKVDKAISATNRNSNSPKQIANTKVKKSEKVEPPKAEPPKKEVIGPIAIANQKAERVFELAPLLAMGIRAQGKIIADKSFSDFPDVTARLLALNLASSANQLLIVSVGRPALLVTTKTTFSTTGYFNLMTMKAFNTETTMGSVPVLIEIDKYADLKKEYDENIKELEQFSLQWIEKELPNYQAEAERIKNEKQLKMETASIASLLLMTSLGENKRNDSSFGVDTFLYSLTRAFTLCHIEKSVNPTSWKQIFSNFTEGRKPANVEFEKKLGEIAHCANGGPFTRQDDIITFKQCMCDNHQDALVPSATQEDNLKEYVKILARTIPISNDDKPTGRSTASQK